MADLLARHFTPGESNCAYCAANLLLRRKTARSRPGIGEGLHGHIDREFPIGPDVLRGIDLWNVFSKLDCPTLVLRGADSEVLLSRTIHEMRERMPHLEVVEFPGVGHAPALMSADQIRVVREFLLR